MTKGEFLKRLEEMLELDKGTLKGDEPLESLPWDSLAVISFIALLDEEFSMPIKAEKIKAATSLADLTALVQDKLQ